MNETPMTDLPMTDVDANDPEVKQLLTSGWQHQGNDMWIQPQSTMHNPVRRDTALRLKQLLDDD